MDLQLPCCHGWDDMCQCRVGKVFDPNGETQLKKKVAKAARKAVNHQSSAPPDMKLKNKLAKSARKGTNPFTKENFCRCCLAHDPDPTELDEGMPSGGDSNLTWKRACLGEAAEKKAAAPRKIKKA